MTKTTMTTFAFALALLATACGKDTPVAPTPPPPANIAGGWTGTFQGTQGGTPFTVAFLMDLTQAGDNVNGTYSTSGGSTFNGTVSGATTPSTFSGSFTFNARTTTGAACTGTFVASGNAGGTTMNWTSPAISATCSNTPVGMTIAVQRR
jgi:hypothetical protein